MKTRPIIFNGEMVCAILDGKKTQTRRVIKPQPEGIKPWKDWLVDPVGIALPIAHSPYGVLGDRLWVRETWFPMQDIAACALDNEPIDTVYKADWDADDISREEARDAGVDRWRPSIFMPRWASRITLEITGVRVERVQKITLTDIGAEGVPVIDMPNAPLAAGFGTFGRFKRLWDSINEKRGYGWKVNPWVWVVEFVQID